MPLEGTTHRPSFDLSLSFPINPLRRANVVSAGVIPKLRKHSRVRLYTQYVRRSMLPLRTSQVPGTSRDLDAAQKSASPVANAPQREDRLTPLTLPLIEK